MRSLTYLLLASSLWLASTGSAEEKFDILFDGKTLEGWKGFDKFWSVQNGSIVGQTTADNPTNGNTFLIWQGGNVGDFEFRCKVRFEGNNSGVQYRSEVVDADNFVLKGYQADLHPNQNYFGMMYGEKTGRGIIAQRGQKIEVGEDGKTQVVGKVGDGAQLTDTEWNELRIIAVGNRLIHQVNGVTTVDITDNHPESFKSGVLGLQLHAGPPMKVEFRNLLYRKLPGDEGKALLQDLVAIASGSSDGDTESPIDNGEWIQAEPKPQWVWADTNGEGQKVAFRHTFEVAGTVKAARVYSTCDNKLTLHINGKKIGSSPDWPQPIEADVTDSVAAGKNTIAADCQNAGGVAAFVLKLVIETADGSTQTVLSNANWRHAEAAKGNWKQPSFDDSAWTAAKVISPFGVQPWGIPRVGGSSDSETVWSTHAVMTPPGFVVDLIHKVTDEQGSWVCLATDPIGRIYASDQAGAGLYRITIQDEGDPLIERVNVGDTAKLSAAQGMLWAFDSLWFHRNGGHLFRVTDSDGDDQLDKVEEIPGGTGGGEHGNHAIILSQDGKKLYLDGGNHAPLGEYVGTRVQQWNEGLLLPRMWDARGHARGKLAPGGWVTELDPKSYEQVVHTIGFRNQYDIALNRFGDIFTYDADMEWDMGMPWYRPTRICHVASGADFGWRSGSGKWPSYYEDSVPPVVNIGPGSPTGVVSGAGTAFPTRYQDAILALDWTFGTIYAIHLEPNGASYTGVAEPFITGSPLAVTDAVVGNDGALYFAVGGRGSKSALYRVRYIGNESTAEPTEVDMTADAARKVRQRLEKFHGVKNAEAVQQAWSHLASDDRFIRNAARVAIESQPVESWANDVLNENGNQSAVTSAVALARMGNESHKGSLLQYLLSLDPSSMTDGQLLGLLRAYALTFINLGAPTAEEREQMIAELDPLLPNENSDVNTELVRVLVYLNSGKVVHETIELIRAEQPVELPDWEDLASRNRNYGGTVQAMLDNHPPTRELMLAFMLRTMRKGWTLEDRRTYFTFLNNAATKAGGSSYSGFLTRIRDEALGTCTDEERKALEDITGENFDPQPDFAIVEIAGPGKKWSLAEALSATGGKPDFEHGRSLYFAAKCASCHRISGLGGNIGPDLTSVRSKFDAPYVVEAIVHPSKDISDQYGSSVVVLDDGRVLNGLAVENDETVTIYSNNPDEKPVTVPKDEVIEMTPSKVSQMPEDLLNKLNKEEIRDLVAYVLSGGDESDRRYDRR